MTSGPAPSLPAARNRCLPRKGTMRRLRLPMSRPTARLAAAHPRSRCNPAPRSTHHPGLGGPALPRRPGCWKERPGGQGTRRHHYLPPWTASPPGPAMALLRARARPRAPGYWVFGGPRSYDPPGRGEPAGKDKARLQETIRANGAMIAGRGTYASSEVTSERSPTASARTWNSSTCSDSQAVSTSDTAPSHVITTQGHRRPVAAPGLATPP